MGYQHERFEREGRFNTQVSTTRATVWVETSAEAINRSSSMTQMLQTDNMSYFSHNSASLDEIYCNTVSFS